MEIAKERIAALQKLRDLESRLQVAPISPLEIEGFFQHPDQYVRICAAGLVGEYRIATALELLASALDDKCEYVADAAAVALGRIGSKEALICLQTSFLSDKIARPHYLANAISSFGRDGFEILAQVAQSPSANLRYYAARGLGSTGIPAAEPILDKLMEDREQTTFGGLVATAAKKALKTLHRIVESEPPSKEEEATDGS